jgi:hypothetical protein
MERGDHDALARTLRAEGCVVNIRNATAGRHLAVPMKDLDGRSILAVVVTFTFHVPVRGAPSIDEASPAEPCGVDEPWDLDAPTGSIRRPSDLFAYAPGTEVLLVGHAFAQEPGATESAVRLRFGPIEKTVVAHGLRVWKLGAFGGVAPGPARPIQDPIPLRWELAFGGADRSDPAKTIVDARNDLGRGVARDPRKLVGQAASQLEGVGGVARGPLAPAGFGAIHRHWLPRRTFAGTYDASWEQTRMPLLPRDFDPRFNVSAPEDQWSATPLRSDEPLEVDGATDDGPIRARLPRVAIGVSSRIEGKVTDHRTQLDRVLIDADRRRVELTFRASVALPDKRERLDDVRIVDKRIA